MNTFTDIVIAVHGIGSQSRNATVRQVADRLGTSPTLNLNDPLATQPLGYFHTEVKDMTAVSAAGYDLEPPLRDTGLAEVFWADIPQEVQKEGRTLEETKAWARTVVGRAEVLYKRSFFFRPDALINPSEFAKMVNTLPWAEPLKADLLEQASSEFNSALSGNKTDAVKGKITDALNKFIRDWNKHEFLESLATLQKKKAESINLQKQRNTHKKTYSRAEVRFNRLLLEEAFHGQFNKVEAAEDAVPPDFGLASEVLEEVIETVYILDNLTFLAEKAGVFKFDLKELLESSLGDIQVVTEFSYYRNDIVGRFQRALEHIHQQYPEANLHIVAHSEGTVVSFLGLLHGMSKQRMLPAVNGNPALKVEQRDFPPWLRKVRGFMTIGSPIDKHLLLWNRIFASLNIEPANDLFSRQRIQWRNYYDKGDPVGFQLDTAREWLKLKNCNAFEFQTNHDIGFTRYYLPGKAHTDYWSDPVVFQHFIDDVMNKEAIPKPVPLLPKTEVKPFITSWVFPYILCFSILAFGTYLLYKGIVNYTHPDQDPLQRYLRFTLLGLSADAGEKIHGWLLFRNSLMLSFFIFGVTVFARLPRLAGNWRGGTIKWFGIAFSAFLLGSCAFYFGIDQEFRREIGIVFEHVPEFWRSYIGPTSGVIALGLVVGLFGLGAGRRTSDAEDRKQRVFWRGARPFMATGLAAALLLACGQIYTPEYELTPAQREMVPTNQWSLFRDTRLNSNEVALLLADPLAAQINVANLAKVSTVLATDPPLWPLVLAGAAFAYLWWLATLIFDLVFVWHRYIRWSTAHEKLMQWSGFSSKKLPRKLPKPEAGKATSEP